MLVLTSLMSPAFFLASSFSWFFDGCLRNPIGTLLPVCFLKNINDLIMAWFSLPLLRLRRRFSTSPLFASGPVPLCGKSLSRRILSELTDDVTQLQDIGVRPSLVPILVGEHSESVKYLERKRLAAKKIGIHMRVAQLSKDATTSQE